MMRKNHTILYIFPLFLTSIQAFVPSSTLSHTNHYVTHSATKLSVATSNDDPYTIQILMSDTGGGHRASANALRDAFDTLHPNQIQCDIVDIYTEYGPFWPFNWYVPAYKIMAEYSFLWKAFYEFGSTDFGLWLNELVLDVFCFEPFKECLNRSSGSTSKRADMVVSVHPLCQDLPLKILAELDSNGSSRDNKDRITPFATVVTDLGGAHPTWFNPKVDKCFVPSDVLRDCAMARNVQPSQITQYGLPIRRGFWGENTADTSSISEMSSDDNKNTNNNLFGFVRNIFSNDETSTESNNENTSTSGVDSLRTELGLKESIPTVLVVGGGDGMGGITQVATALGKTLSSEASSSTPNSEDMYQMVVVCGKNEAAQTELSNYEWGTGINVQVKGFVNNMDEWMRASDALVTKAGPGTIAEASICGLPCMLSSFLPGQEEGNVPFVENSGFGQYSGDPDVIASTVSKWLASPEMLKDMKEAALKAARPQATLDIARDLAQMVFETRNTQK